MKIKKDDYVQVISGDDRDQRGKVLRVFPEKGLAIVEGVNYIYRHMRKTSKNSQGGRVQKEAAIQICKLKIYCPHCQSATRAFYAFEEEKKESQEKSPAAEEKAVPSKIKVRCCRKCKRRI